MSRSALSLEREDDGATVVVRVSGELDLHTHQDLRDELRRVPPATERLVLDLGEVTFMDSSGIGAIGLAQQAVDEGGLVLVVQSQHLRKLIRIAGLDRTARLCRSLPEALHSLPPTS